MLWYVCSGFYLLLWDFVSKPFLRGVAVAWQPGTPHSTRGEEVLKHSPISLVYRCQLLGGYVPLFGQAFGLLSR